MKVKVGTDTGTEKNANVMIDNTETCSENERFSSNIGGRLARIQKIVRKHVISIS